MGARQSSEEFVYKRPAVRARRRGADLDDDLPSTRRATQPPLSAATWDKLWRELPEHIKKDPAFRDIGANLPGCSGTARQGGLSSVTEEGEGGGEPAPRQTADTEADGAGEASVKVSVTSPHQAGKGKLGKSLQGPENTPKYIRYPRMALLLAAWLVFTWILITRREHEETNHQVSVPKNQVKSYIMQDEPTERQVAVAIRGALLPPEYGNLTDSFMVAWIEMVRTRIPLAPSQRHNFSMHVIRDEIVDVQNVSKPWRVPLVSAGSLDMVPDVKRHHIFLLDDFEVSDTNVLVLQLRTNLRVSFPVSIHYDTSPIDMENGVVYAALVLFSLYAMIILEVVNRTLAAMVASTMSVAILAAFNERPPMEELVRWIDVETLLLLFSMMILVTIFAQSGVFDFIAYAAYLITKGRIWPLVMVLGFFTILLSIFLDNVTTVMLMTPVTISLCEFRKLNPVPVLTCMMIYSNIGGAITPVGDPPNVILATNNDVTKAGVNFGVFTYHMSMGTLLVLGVVQVQLFWLFSCSTAFQYAEPVVLQEIRHEIAIWRRTAASLSSYTRDEEAIREALLNKVRTLWEKLQQQCKETGGRVPPEPTLNTGCSISSWPLLGMGVASLAFVVGMFCAHSFPGINLSMGWSALLGALLLLILSELNVDEVLNCVEWGTLLFFAELFVLMECLSRLGLIECIGRQTENLILGVDDKYQLAVAITLILWVSAFVSAFVDNIPLCTMMVRVVCSLAQNPELSLPLQPLVWALAFGACLGGNGTLIGSSSNVVCAGLAEQHGYKMTFMQFFRVGFPVMLVSLSTATMYLLIAHVWCDWNGTSA